MKNTLYQQLYKCLCGLITKHYVWSVDLNKSKFKCGCGKKLTTANIHTEEKPEVPGIRTPTKNR